MADLVSFNPGPRNEFHVSVNYALNIERSLAKKLRAAQKTAEVTVKQTGGGIVVEADAATFELYKEATLQYYTNEKIAGKKNLFITETTDARGSIVQYTIRILCDDNQNYTINIYTTTSKCMVNGKGVQTFFTDLDDIRTIIEKAKAASGFKTEAINQLFQEQIAQALGVVEKSGKTVKSPKRKKNKSGIASNQDVISKNTVNALGGTSVLVTDAPGMQLALTGGDPSDDAEEEADSGESGPEQTTKKSQPEGNVNSAPAASTVKVTQTKKNSASKNTDLSLPYVQVDPSNKTIAESVLEEETILKSPQSNRDETVDLTNEDENNTRTIRSIGSRRTEEKKKANTDSACTRCEKMSELRARQNRLNKFENELKIKEGKYEDALREKLKLETYAKKMEHKVGELENIVNTLNKRIDLLGSGATSPVTANVPQESSVQTTVKLTSLNTHFETLHNRLSNIAFSQINKQLDKIEKSLNEDHVSGEAVPEPTTIMLQPDALRHLEGNPIYFQPAGNPERPLGTNASTSHYSQPTGVTCTPAFQQPTWNINHAARSADQPMYVQAPGGIHHPLQNQAGVPSHGASAQTTHAFHPTALNDSRPAVLQAPRYGPPPTFATTGQHGPSTSTTVCQAPNSMRDIPPPQYQLPLQGSAQVQTPQYGSSLPVPPPNTSQTQTAQTPQSGQPFPPPSTAQPQSTQYGPALPPPSTCEAGIGRSCEGGDLTPPPFRRGHPPQRRL